MLGQRLKVLFCALLAVVAVLCLVATLADIGALGDLPKSSQVTFF